MVPVLTLTPEAARRFVLRALGLQTPHPTMAAALRHHGYVQIDPINICGRMHDHILRPRVHAYREGDLLRHLHGDEPPLPASARTAFEHHLPSSGILVALEPEAWPHLQGAMRARTRTTSAWSGRLTPRERTLVPVLLDAIGERGPLGSEDFSDSRKARSVWGAATLVKSTLQKLFFHGRLLIASRRLGRRRYDLPERVLPRAVLDLPAAQPEETARWEVLLKLRQRRLVTLKRNERGYVDDLVQPVQVADCPALFCLRSDLPLLDEGAAPDGAAGARLIAPLDPLVYDRALTRKLWNFDYTWEVYTPPAKRRRGYYALPLLEGTALIGDVDLRANRAEGGLEVVSRRVERAASAHAAVAEVAHFLGLKPPGARSRAPRSTRVKKRLK